MRRAPLVLLCLSLGAGTVAGWAGERRPLTVDDLFALEELDDPQVSPDGAWVAFTRKALDRKKDAANVDLAMVALSGGEPLRLTSHEKGESSPRFSPDGRHLAFLSAREGKHTQVWLLDRRGGEAIKLTDFHADVSELAWSPDGGRLALVVGDVDPDEPDEDEHGKADDEDEADTPKPIVIRRLQFKEDGEGYLRELHRHVFVFELATKASRQLTAGPYDDGELAWSPDGHLLAFSSNRTAEPDSNEDRDVFLVEVPPPGPIPPPGSLPGEGAPQAAPPVPAPRQLTKSPGSDQSPCFTPDGRSVVYLEGGDPKDIWYATNQVAVVPASGGEPRALTRQLDRNVSGPRVSPDGQFVYFLLEDRGTQHLARINVAGGSVERIVAGERVVDDYALGSHGEVVVLESTPEHPAELAALAGATLRRLTTVNDAWLGGIALGEVRRLQATSRDGTKVDAFLTLPPGTPWPPAKPLPTILRIHGGPTSQYQSEFMFEWQLLAAHGYAVVAANPRGSTGYGRDFSRAIWADWGNKDYEDVMAAVDAAITTGVADPDHLGVGGWSYGGILTNYVIAKTNRFKAAISGASEVNYLSNYGTDHYQKWWEAELGLPWENVELWTRLSPFFQVAKITTPTLLLGGSDDMNVPLLNSEQLYQALRRLGRQTELVIYPGENHSIATPSYRRDRLERYLAWYDTYVRGTPPPAAAARGAKAP